MQELKENLFIDSFRDFGAEKIFGTSNSLESRDTSQSLYLILYCQPPSSRNLWTYPYRQGLEQLHTYDEALLLQQLAEGSEAAFREIFRNFYGRLVFYAQHLSLSREEAEDAVMETFTRCWTARADFQSFPALRSWLYTVTRYVTIDVLRKKSNHPVITFEDANAIDDDAAERERIHAEAVARIMQEIDKLPEKCRQVVLLTYRDGLSTAQIAERLNISPSNVTSQRSRALSLLKMAFADRSSAWIPVMLSVLRCQFP